MSNNLTHSFTMAGPAVLSFLHSPTHSSTHEAVYEVNCAKPHLLWRLFEFNWRKYIFIMRKVSTKDEEDANFHHGHIDISIACPVASDSLAAMDSSADFTASG